jgi:transcriptional regulator GlxA family with amidase domain
MVDNKNRLKKVHVALAAHLREIHTVQDWADRTGFTSGRQFARQYLRCYHEHPKKSIQLARLNRIIDVILFQPDRSGYEIAWEAGLEDEKALYDFLHYHTGLILTELRDFLPPPTEMEKFRSKSSERKGLTGSKMRYKFWTGHMNMM